ncbi:hypothetical protein LIER_21514 [Lithospermum erythrorhizon]|uniref:Uncharacterized protein n=1 Tax=Lithospermum erythrorhizon TaxID=34254 RepID=A0AAV3QUN3_LITER
MNPSDRLLISRARNYGKWWLHIHEQQKSSVQENVDNPENVDRPEKEFCKSNTQFSKSKTELEDQSRLVYGEKQLIEEYFTKAKPCPYGLVSIDRQCKVIENYVRLEQNSTKEELNIIIGDDLHKPPENKHKICSKDTYTKDLDSYICQDSQSSGKECSELDYYLKAVENSEPWLYTSDRGDLSSFVSYRSQAHVENHDILGYQIFGRSSTACSYNYDKVKDKTESYMATETHSTLGNLASAIMDEGMTPSNPIECSTNSSAKVNRNDGLNASNQTIPGTEVQLEHNVDRLHLLEALCHSQTRAREAEKFAQQNCDEKEQIIKLYFRQASQLFAYKQWVEILRLENLILQLRNSGVYISANFPVRTKGRQTRKGKRWTEKRNNGKPKTETGNSFIAFAIGLGLAGAGLLLGWTIGWMFSTF